MSVQNIKMKPTIKFWALWLLPVLLALGFEVFSGNFAAYRWRNVVENMLFISAMLLTVNFFDSIKLKKFLLNFYFLVFAVCLFFEGVFFYLFGSIFTASAIFILSETNAVEAQEFLGFYLDFPILIYALLLVGTIFLYFNFPKNFFPKFLSLRIKIISGTLFVCVLVFLKFSGLIVPNFPYLVLKSGWEYVEEQQKMADIHIDNRIGNFEEVKHISSSDKSLYILILGESTARDHLGLYGYYRNTTPKLNEIKNELLVYKNVISSNSFTVGALKEALTLNNFEKEKESSIVQLMNQADFKTFWLSNQRPLGPYESLTTKIAQAADVVKFTNSAIDGGVTPYDEVLLSYFENALSDSANKKFIVLHILGTHMQYKNRYPDSFSFFKDRPNSNFDDELAYLRINRYDNAVRYMDSFIRNVIEKTRSQNRPAYVLYFSDHGEEVYKNRYFAGHQEANPTKNMFEVPFVLWRSKEFKGNGNAIFEGNIEAPYVLDDFLYSWADLSQIEFSEMQKTKSIFSKKFQSKKRVVGQGIDFDSFFEK